MKILIWLAVPLALTLLSWIAYRIANRPAGPLTPEESMQAHQRLLQVLETPVPAPAPSRWSSTPVRSRQAPTSSSDTMPSTH